MPDESAQLLRALHDEHGPALWRYVVWLTGDRQFAEDVVQETLVRAWRRPKVLDQSESSAKAWLFTVARNLVIDTKRSGYSRHEIPTDLLPERPVEGSLEDSVAESTDAMLDAWLVSDALSALSADHRLVVVHAYYRGHSIAEIAAELQVPPGTVKSRLHYALRALRLALQERGMTE